MEYFPVAFLLQKTCSVHDHIRLSCQYKITRLDCDVVTIYAFGCPIQSTLALFNFASGGAQETPPGDGLTLEWFMNPPTGVVSL